MELLKVMFIEGIVFNKETFQFCEDTVEFAGPKITLSGIAPSDCIFSARKDFPTSSQPH